MKLADLFTGRPDFASKSEIIEYIRNSKNFDPNVEDLRNADALLIFSTSKQNTWIVATKERLYCVLDDVRKDQPNINWSMPRGAVVSQGRISLPIRSRDKSDFTGLVDIGETHRDWLFTKRLFSTDPIETRIQALIQTTMLDK